MSRLAATLLALCSLIKTSHTFYLPGVAPQDFKQVGFLDNSNCTKYVLG
jgi:hypothetical protein